MIKTKITTPNKSNKYDKNRIAKIGAAIDNNVDDNAYDGDNYGDGNGKKKIMATKHMTMTSTTWRWYPMQWRNLHFPLW